ncbi:hypothetical protein HY486_04125 [Candidatus Woesearchaeota archaeon]|nr:hypothetical protein [Candidatus Woesearchaeota archaeon]
MLKNFDTDSRCFFTQRKDYQNNITNVNIINDDWLGFCMLKDPESMEGLIYFTRQMIKSGNAVAWVRKALCPKCKTQMGKPVEKGKIKIRAKEYTCPKCNYSESAEEHLKKLNAEIKYKCPHCSANGETTIPFMRKKIRILSEEDNKEILVEALQFQCDKCKEKINITKKMKG